MLSTINNWRRQTRPPLPKSLKDYVNLLNMEQWKHLLTHNLSNLQVMSIESNDGSSAAVLADKNFLKTINTTHLLIDATYEVCPRAPTEIYQFLTIMAMIEDNVSYRLLITKCFPC